MKALLVGFFLSIAFPIVASAGELGVAYTYQVLSGIAEDIPRVEKVNCYDTCALSGMPAAFQLIAAKNVPPNNAREPVADVNLASASGITIRVLESKGRYGEGINARDIRVPERLGVKPTELIKAVRRTAISVKVTDYRITIQATDDFKGFSERQLEAFEAHNKENAFWES